MHLREHKKRRAMNCYYRFLLSGLRLSILLPGTKQRCKNCRVILPTRLDSILAQHTYISLGPIGMGLELPSKPFWLK